MIGTDEGKRKELLSFLNQRVFDPILRALPENYKGEDLKGKLSNVKRRAESEKHLFHEFQTADEIKRKYLAALDFRTAKRIDHELDELKLPSLTKAKEDFLSIGEELRV